MISISPEQELFNSIHDICTRIGITYDHLPGDVAYPFIYIGEQFSTDDQRKDAILGNITQTIHFYGFQTKRGSLTSMMNDVLYACRNLKHTEHFYVVMRGVDKSILQDNTTNTPLNHGILEIEYQLN